MKSDTKPGSGDAQPLIPAVGRQKKADLFGFKASPVYILSFRILRVTQKNAISEIKQKTNNKKKWQTKHEELRWKPQCTYEKFDMAVYTWEFTGK